MTRPLLAVLAGAILAAIAVGLLALALGWADDAPARPSISVPAHARLLEA